MGFAEQLSDAQKEFEKLTTAQAATLKNKGKEKGLAALTVAFKNGKTLQQRASDFDKVYDITLSVKTTPEQATKVAKSLQVAYAKFSEGLKKNRDEFDKLAKEIGPADPKIKAGHEIFSRRLEQIRMETKLKVEGKLNDCKSIITGEALKGDAKLASNVRTAYLGIRKGAEESEALIKKFLAEPTRENAVAVLSSGTGPRSMGVGVTTWKNLVLKTNPGMADRLVDAGGGVPEHILNPVYDITQNKGEPFWVGKLKLDNPGWEGRVKTQLQELHKVIGHLRRSADAMKQLVG